MSLRLASAALNPLSCSELPISVKIVSIPTIPYSEGESNRPNIIPKVSTRTCWAPLFMAPQKSPFAVFSFSDCSVMCSTTNYFTSLPGFTSFSTEVTASDPSKFSAERIIPSLTNPFLN